MIPPKGTQPELPQTPAQGHNLKIWIEKEKLYTKLNATQQNAVDSFLQSPLRQLVRREEQLQREGAEENFTLLDHHSFYKGVLLRIFAIYNEIEQTGKSPLSGEIETLERIIDSYVSLLSLKSRLECIKELEVIAEPKDSKFQLQMGAIAEKLENDLAEQLSTKECFEWAQYMAKEEPLDFEFILKGIFDGIMLKKLEMISQGASDDAETLIDAIELLVRSYTDAQQTEALTHYNEEMEDSKGTYKENLKALLSRFLSEPISPA